MKRFFKYLRDRVFNAKEKEALCSYEHADSMRRFYGLNTDAELKKLYFDRFGLRLKIVEKRDIFGEKTK